MNKDDARKSDRFYLVDPKEIDTYEEWAEYLESILTGPCTILPFEGKPSLIVIKALIANIRGMKIEVFSKEHPPPHFHVYSANIDACFKIRDCKLLDGKIGSMDYSKILYWYNSGAKELLINKWNESRPSACVVGKYLE